VPMPTLPTPIILIFSVIVPALLVRMAKSEVRVVAVLAVFTANSLTPD